MGIIKTDFSQGPHKPLRELEELKPLQICETCGTNVEFYLCWCKPKSCSDVRAIGEPVRVANDVCDLGEQCRCKADNNGDCWNSKVGKV